MPNLRSVYYKWDEDAELDREGNLFLTLENIHGALLAPRLELIECDLHLLLESALEFGFDFDPDVDWANVRRIFRHMHRGHGTHIFPQIRIVLAAGQENSTAAAAQAIRAGLQELQDLGMIQFVSEPLARIYGP